MSFQQDSILGKLHKIKAPCSHDPEFDVIPDHPAKCMPFANAPTVAAAKNLCWNDMESAFALRGKLLNRHFWSLQKMQRQEAKK